MFRCFLSEQNSSLESLWSTVEPVDLVLKAYPNLVNNYLDTISAKTKKSAKGTKSKNKNGESQPTTKKNQKKSTKTPDNIVSDEENVNPEKLKKPKKQLQQKNDEKIQPIDKYFKKVKTLPNITTPKMKQKSLPSARKNGTQSPKIQTCSTPLSLTELSFDFNNSCDDIHDLSDIINGIVSNTPTITDICGKKLHYESVNAHPQPIEIIDGDDKEDTRDEFDIIVAAKNPTSLDSPKISRKKNKKRPSDKCPSTTPILIKKFFKRNCIDYKSSSSPTISPKTSPRNLSLKSISSPKEANVSYFFGDITEENDVFEKLTDFRNMEDEFCTDDAEDMAFQGEKLPDDSPKVELSETFDLDDYVPVGANLRKRLAS